MTPIVAPLSRPTLKDPFASIAQGIKPEVAGSDGALLAATMQIEGDELVVRLPIASLSYADMRKKAASHDSSTGKEKNPSATLVASVTPADGKPIVLKFDNGERGKVLMPVRPNVNLILGLNWKAVELERA